MFKRKISETFHEKNIKVSTESSYFYSLEVIFLNLHTTFAFEIILLVEKAQHNWKNCLSETIDHVLRRERKINRERIPEQALSVFQATLRALFDLISR